MVGPRPSVWTLPVVTANSKKETPYEAISPAGLWGVVFHIPDGRLSVDGSPSFCPMFARLRGAETRAVTEGLLDTETIEALLSSALRAHTASV